MMQHSPLVVPECMATGGLVAYSASQVMKYLIAIWNCIGALKRWKVLLATHLLCEAAMIDLFQRC
jgi:hypothetical protein